MILKTVEKKENSTAVFTVEVDAAEFEAAVNAAYLKNKKSIFRASARARFPALLLRACSVPIPSIRALLKSWLPRLLPLALRKASWTW